MPVYHASAIKGISIALIVISGLWIIGITVGFIFLWLSGMTLDEMGYEVLRTQEFEAFEELYAQGYTAPEIASATMVVFFFLGLGMLWLFLSGACSLIAGITGLRNGAFPLSLRPLTAWGIVGACMSLLTGRLATLVLCIIVAVFANRDRRTFMDTHPSNPYTTNAVLQPPYGYGS